jgi:REP element-mobilizing transposase RayT
MPRKQRIDYPGAVHHITNRGIAKRPIFERLEDIRYFESRLAHSARRGEIRARSFSLMTTHFHLYVESVEGRIGRAMQRIQGEYSRYFNRRRRRDGSLYRGRYFSAVVTSQAYADNLVRYIDGNAVQAGLVADPAWHHACSAHWYAKKEGPRWLDREALEARAAELCGAKAFTTDLYAKAFRPRYSDSFQRWILQRLAAGEGAPDPLDDLIDAAHPKVLAWMRRKARLADGTPSAVACPLVPSEDLEAACAKHAESLAALDGAGDVRGFALAGLLRDVAGLTLGRIANIVGRTAPAVSYRVDRHRALLARPDYGRIVATITSEALNAFR